MKKTASFLLSMLDFGIFFEWLSRQWETPTQKSTVEWGHHWCRNFVLLQQFLWLIPDMYVQQKIDEHFSTSVTSD